MRNVFTKAVTVATLIAVGFGTFTAGFASVSAADGDHKARYDFWDNKTGRTAFYYQIDLGRALQKDDVKTALEAMDFWIKEQKSFNAPQSHLNKLEFYKSEIAKKRLHEGLFRMMNHTTNGGYWSAMDKTMKGELSGYTYIKYDNFFTREDDLAATSTEPQPNYPNKPSTPTTPTQPDFHNNEKDVPDLTSAPTNPTTPGAPIPIPKKKEINSYLKFLDRINQNAFKVVANKIDRLIRTKLVPKFNRMTPAQKQKTLDPIYRKIDALQNKEKSFFKKATIAQIKIDLDFYIKD